MTTPPFTITPAMVRLVATISEQVEYKAGRNPAVVLRSICAFANKCL